MKKYLLGLFAITLAIAFSAYTSAPASKTSTVYYVFEGADDNDLDVAQQWDLTPLAEAPDQCEDTDAVVCFVSSEKSPEDFEDFLDTHPGISRSTLDAQTDIEVLSTRD